MKEQTRPTSKKIKKILQQSNQISRKTEEAHDNFGVYDDESVKEWKIIAYERLFRDMEYYKRLIKYFNQGSVLELGGAVGYVGQILEDLDFKVVCSDYFNFFVEYQKKVGLEAYKIDATDIEKYTDKKFDNILAQGLSPIMRRDDKMVPQTYRSIHGALNDNGKLIMIQTAYRHKPSKKKIYLTLKEQLNIIDEMKIFKIEKVLGHQIVHHKMYSWWNKKYLAAIDFTLGSIIPFRHVIICQKIS